MKNPTPRPGNGDRSDRTERGTALVLVLILIVALLGMLAYLIPQSQMSIKSQSQTRELVDMRLLLRAAVAEAIDEVTEKIDPDAEGTAAVGTSIDDSFWSSGTFGSFDRTNPAHLAVLGKELKAGNRTMGRYATWVTKPVGGEFRLHVIAVYPDFVNPRQTAGAEIRIAESLGGRNAVSFSGSFSGGGGNFGVQFKDDVRLDINGGAYAAFNVSDPDMFTGVDEPGGFTTFIDDIMTGGSNLGGAGTITGLSTGEGPGKGSPPWSGVAASDWDSIENISEEDLQLSNATIDEVADDFLAIINGARANDEKSLYPQPAGGTKFDEVDNMTDASSPDGAFNLNNLVGTHNTPPDPATETVWRLHNAATQNLEVNGRDIQGSGSLLITGHDIDFKDGTTMVWNGDVFMIGGSNTHHHISDADLTINGNLYIIMDTGVSSQTLKLHINHDDAKLTVNGSIVLVASGVNNKVDFHVDKAGADVTVNGLFLSLGDDVSFQVEGKDAGTPANFQVNGSLIAGVPSGGGITEFEFTRYVLAQLNYDETNFEESAEEFGEATDALKKFTNAGYLEVAGATKLDAFHRALTNSDGTDTNNVFDDPTWTLDPGNTTVDAEMGF